MTTKTTLIWSFYQDGSKVSFSVIYPDPAYNYFGLEFKIEPPYKNDICQQWCTLIYNMSQELEWVPFHTDTWHGVDDKCSGTHQFAFWGIPGTNEKGDGASYVKIADFILDLAEIIRPRK